MVDRPLPIVTFLGANLGGKSVRGMIWDDEMAHIDRDCPKLCFIK